MGMKQNPNSQLHKYLTESQARFLKARIIMVLRPEGGGGLTVRQVETLPDNSRESAAKIVIPS